MKHEPFFSWESGCHCIFVLLLSETKWSLGKWYIFTWICFNSASTELLIKKQMVVVFSLPCQEEVVLSLSWHTSRKIAPTTPQKCVSIIFCVGMFYMFFATTSSECFSFGELCVGFKQSNKVRLGGVKKMLHFCSAVLGEKKGDWATCQVFLFKNRLNVCQLGDCHLWYVVPPPLKQLECES